MDREIEKCVYKVTESLTEIVCEFKKHVDEGVANFDTEEASNISDIIKDLADARKNIYESCYYESVIEAMGKGVKVQYKPYMDQKPYNNMYLGINRPEDPSFNQSYASDPNGVRMGFDPGPEWDRYPGRYRMSVYDPNYDWDEEKRDLRRPDRPDIHVAEPNR